jgi:hypothetical protein
MSLLKDEITTDFYEVLAMTEKDKDEILRSLRSLENDGHLKGEMLKQVQHDRIEITKQS